MKNLLMTALVVLVVVLSGKGQVSAQQQDVTSRIEQARSRLGAIQQRSTRIKDINDIENLQRIYGYYTDKMLWDHVADLFSENGTMEIGFSGVYAGKENIRKYLYSLSDGKQGPVEGEMYNHMQFQPVITLSEDGKSAKGRWRTLMQLGSSGSGSGGQWGEGPYENEYVKEDGIWKISKLHWYATFISPYEGGWLNVTEDTVRDYSISEEVNPDLPAGGEYSVYPDIFVPAFHFNSPVTDGDR